MLVKESERAPAASPMTDEQWARRMLLSLGETLSYSDYARLTNAIRKHPQLVASLKPYKIAILRNHTVDPLVQVVEGEVLRAGLRPEIYVGEYDASAQEALDPGGPLHAFAPDLILMLNWIEGASPLLAHGHVGLSQERVDAEIERLRIEQDSLLAALRARSEATIIVNNHPLPPAPTLGILDIQRASGHGDAILRLDHALRESAARVRGVFTLDLRRIFADIGWSQAVDGRMWHLARAPFSKLALVEIGRDIGRFARALRGGVRKCLVLDCDNTLWGGVIGEDGLGGVKLGQSYPGSCYLDLQQVAKNLAARGVILALCTKNNHDDVIEVLDQHADMVLRQGDFVSMKINWTDKVENLKAIAAELNIGVDSLVFVDDNPFEIENVRERLPQVATILLDGKPTEFAARLARCGLFDSLSFSEEDRERASMYQADKRRDEMREQAASLDEYLAMLEIKAEIGPISQAQAPRVSQLTQKTNQFNMTTRRHSESDIERLAAGPETAVYHLTARDRASNLGLVGFAAVSFGKDSAEITDFLMSCRALGRGLEDAMMAVIAEEARKRGAGTLVGRFIPTKKNQLSAGFYEKRGFAADGEETWSVKLEEGVLPVPRWVGLEAGGADGR